MDRSRLLALAIAFASFGVARAGAVPAEPEVPPPAAVKADPFAGGNTLHLLPIKQEDLPDEDSARHFLLSIPISARPRVHIVMSDVVIHVLFFDLVDRKIVPTAAGVKSRWVNPPISWEGAEPEVLAVEYNLPKPKAAIPEDRRYYGYIVRVYYQGKLQATTAEPERLAQVSPPPPPIPYKGDH